DFKLTPAIEHEVAQMVQRSRAEQAQAARRAEAEGAAPFRMRSDEALYREALGVARRNWLAQETQSALAGKASLEDAVYGDDAIEAYHAGGSGHLVSSPQSMLGF